MNDFAKWFCRVLWISITIDVILGLLALFFPNSTLRGLGMRPTDDIAWTAFGGMAVLMIALLERPAARDPYRYKETATASVIVKGAFALFFLILWPSRYPAFGFLALFFFLIEWALLWLMRKTPHPEWQATSA